MEYHQVSMYPYCSRNSYIITDDGVDGFQDSDDTDSDNPTNEKCNFPQALKIYIYNLLERSSQRCQHKQSGLPWQTLLLYLCRDASFEIALRKAFTVLASTMYDYIK
jgi:hypothetical protein